MGLRSNRLPLLFVVAAALASSCGEELSTLGLNAGSATSDFVVYAQRKVRIGEHSRILGGDVGVARLAPAEVGPQLVVERHAFVDPDHNLIAPSVKLERRAFVGDVQTSSLANQGARVGTVAAFPSSMPPLPLVAPIGGTGNDVFVRHRKRETLAPGDYSDLKNFGTVLLEPGVYSFASVTLGDGAELLALDGEADVRIAGRLHAGRGAALGPARGRHGGSLKIGVTGTNGHHGSAAASLGDHVTIAALLAVPRGTLKLGDAVVGIGAFAAFDVETGEHVKLTFKKGFAGSTGTQPITSYVAPPSSPVVGPLPGNTTVSLVVGLPLRDLAGLQAVIDQASNPTSPMRGQYLSAAELKANHAPTDADYAAMVGWAQAQNLKVVTYANNLGAGVVGTASQIEQAFHANLIRARRPDGSEFYQLDGPPSVDLGMQLLGVSGIDNYVRPRLAAGTAPAPGGYQSSDLRGAYLGGPGSACIGFDGAGQSVGIMAFAGFDPTDITTYQSNTGLTGVPTVLVETSDDPNGLPPDQAPPLSTSGNIFNTEISLDIEMAIAMAPAAQVVVFQGNGSADNVLLNMVNHPLIAQFSTSWLIGTTALTPTYLAAMAGQGQTFVVGSGDWGAAQPPTAMCPAAVLQSVAMGNTVLDVANAMTDIRTMDNVTVIGGTVLSTAGGLWSAETVWSGSGGGVLSNVPIPAYQANLNAGNMEVSTTNRNFPDVAMNSATIYVVTTTCTTQMGATPLQTAPCAAAQQVPNTAFQILGGTSASGPMFAGFMALANQSRQAQGGGRVGFANPTLYQIGQDPARYANAFHDIGAVGGGTSANACGFTHNAQAGYDLITGWGTPQCGLITEITGTPQAPSIVVVATEGAQGVRFCIQGQGFQPGHLMHYRFLDLPNNHFDVNSTEMVLVGASGRFTNFDPTFGGGASSVQGFIQFCSAQDATELMTVLAFQVDDPSIMATAQILNTWVCGFEPTQTSMTATPLPFPPPGGIGQTTCPLPPD